MSRARFTGVSPVWILRTTRLERPQAWSKCSVIAILKFLINSEEENPTFSFFTVSHKLQSRSWLSPSNSSSVAGQCLSFSCRFIISPSASFWSDDISGRNPLGQYSVHWDHKPIPLLRFFCSKKARTLGSTTIGKLYAGCATSPLGNQPLPRDFFLRKESDDSILFLSNDGPTEALHVLLEAPPPLDTLNKSILPLAPWLLHLSSFIPSRWVRIWGSELQFLVPAMQGLCRGFSFTLKTASSCPVLFCSQPLGNSAETEKESQYSAQPHHL